MRISDWRSDVCSSDLLDKCFSDLLEPNANEVHAANMSDGYLQGLLHRLWNNAQQDRVIMLNQKFTAQDGDPPVLSPRAVVDTVRIGLKRFRPDLGRTTIANVGLKLHVNPHNNQ